MRDVPFVAEKIGVVQQRRVACVLDGDTNRNDIADTIFRRQSLGAIHVTHQLLGSNSRGVPPWHLIGNPHLRILATRSDDAEEFRCSVLE